MTSTVSHHAHQITEIRIERVSFEGERWTRIVLIGDNGKPLESFSVFPVANEPIPVCEVGF